MLEAPDISTSASQLVDADLGIAQLHGIRTNAEMIANLCPVGSGPPLIADMNTGYDGLFIIALAIQAHVQAGVASFHIEDQIVQKRCSHLQGKEVVDIGIFVQYIKACMIACAWLRSDIVIITRIDTYQSRGYKECLGRLRTAGDSGADMGILEGSSPRLASWPLCLKQTIVFSFAALALVYVAIKKSFELLKSKGVTGTPENIPPKLIFQAHLLDKEAEFDAATGGLFLPTRYNTNKRYAKE
ncbi:Pyruvate/Phosphoenolpyruvate kinase-like domain-containing protein [Calycina marina]|uniref:Pyruvate/Phosphoenolpyruvate kinase-like domain-containing protein n=1 Tax=Calycina marina TaxID=1763456 RepID=A0A9P8CJN2_9HELO|nr:Pyruvate/Phosphoenolpyruvate kinase-like domain-containing protein [Calycina marina]